MRLIDADKLVAKLEYEWKHTDALVGTGFMLAALFTMSAPTIDHEELRPTMQWTLSSDGYGVCSNCNRGDHIDPLAKFCRYCGAKMEEET